MLPARHILCIHLPHWTITRRLRRHREWHSRAVAIIRTIRQRRVVVDVSSAAAKSGIKPGMTAAEARTLNCHLCCFDDDPVADRRAIETLGRWLTRFTPIVSSEWADDDDNEDAPAALWLDLTGCDRLFGGITQAVESISISLQRFGISANIAMAPTVGSAWAFALMTDRSPRVVKAEELSQAIRILPVTTLRLSADVLRRLHDVGLMTVGNVLALPRELLPARFGPLLARRLDQLTGELPEPLVGLLYDPPVTASHRFDAPIESPEHILAILEPLLDAVLSDLAKRGDGVRTLRLTLRPDRGWGLPVVIREIALSCAHRHRKTLFELMRRQIERIDCEHGFVAFGLDVPLHEPVTETQADFCEGQSDADAMEFELLLQRVRARLGDQAVIRPQLVESYLPERAWRPASEGGKRVADAIPFSPPRPSTLFPMPIEIDVLCEPSDDRTGRPRQFTWQSDVHQLVHIVGPERIGCEWWRGHRHTRDYFDVEDERGLRCWIFRVLHVRSPDHMVARWFLHGRFD